jgi:hypothetical protein
MRSIKLYGGIDYQFQPESYWSAADNPLEAALRNVKGRNRREMIRDYHRAGKLEEYSQCNLECGAELEHLRHFVRVESDYYPELAEHYAQAVDEWYDARLAELSGES